MLCGNVTPLRQDGFNNNKSFSRNSLKRRWRLSSCDHFQVQSSKVYCRIIGNKEFWRRRRQIANILMTRGRISFVMTNVNASTHDQRNISTVKYSPLYHPRNSRIFCTSTYLQICFVHRWLKLTEIPKLVENCGAVQSVSLLTFTTVRSNFQSIVQFTNAEPAVP